MKKRRKLKKKRRKLKKIKIENDQSMNLSFLMFDKIISLK